MTQRTHAAAKAAVWFDVATVNVVLLALGAALFIGYLVMNNMASTKGFGIRTAQRTITALEDDRKKLDMQAVAAQSLQRVQDQISGLGMIQVKDVDYVNAAPPNVAMR